MDYTKEIIEMIEKMESVRFLAMIYSFTHTLFEKRSREIKPEDGGAYFAPLFLYNYIII